MFTQLQNSVQKVSVQFGQMVSRGNAQRVEMNVVGTEGTTKGLMLKYQPILGRNGLFDSEGVRSVVIPNFSEVQRYIFGAYTSFKNGENRTEMSRNLSRSIFEAQELGLRFTVTGGSGSTYVTLTVIDSNSPFYMLTMPFTVIEDRQNPGNLYILGYGNFYNQQANTFENINAYLAPKKQRVIPVVYDKNDRVSYARINLAVNGMNQIIANNKGVGVNGGQYEYMQKVNSKYKAMAMVVESELLDFAFSQYNQQEAPAQQPEPAENQQMSEQSLPQSTPQANQSFGGVDLDKYIAPQQQQSQEQNQQQSFGEALSEMM